MVCSILKMEIWVIVSLILCRVYSIIHLFSYPLQPWSWHSTVSTVYVLLTYFLLLTYNNTYNICVHKQHISKCYISFNYMVMCITFKSCLWKYLKLISSCQLSASFQKLQPEQIMKTKKTKTVTLHLCRENKQ